MKRNIYVVALTITFSTFLHDTFATDLFFSDISVESPSKRYKVEAKSPDNNDKKEHKAFQASFVYTCWDTNAKKLLWTRNQPMGEPQPLGDGSAETYVLPKEASPVGIFVSDLGWTLIQTNWDELIIVDLSGQDRGRIDLLSNALTKEEQTKYVRQTTAGPVWAGYSLWYFLDVQEQHLFIIRPWWGRRVIVNLEAGKIIQETEKISASASGYERNYVLTELAKAVTTRKDWEKNGCCEAIRPVFNASYFAGRLQMKEAIPFLEKLQESSVIDSSTWGGPGLLDQFKDEVNPFIYSTSTLRQVIHLSLRRLGTVPKPLPIHQFDIQPEDSEERHPYLPRTSLVTRDSNVDKVKQGMKAEQVLDLLGSPDFIHYNTWEYDIDSKLPYTLIIKWDIRNVLDIRKKTPALWKDGFVRDEQLMQ